MSRLFVGAGRVAGVRPKDLVGAIEIADRFSIVEVPETEADAVITALRGTTIKGKRPTIRRDRGRR